MKKLLITFFLLCLLGGCTKEKTLVSWEEDAPFIDDFNDYIKEVTDKNSKHFIPQEDRIAVFDFDGTLYLETAPIYSEWLIFKDYVLEHQENYSDDLIDLAKELDAISDPSLIPSDMESRHIIAHAKAFAGLTIDEYTQIVSDFKEKNALRFNNLTYKDAFYRPMLEVIDYLLEHDFIVYICSGTNRFTVRTMIEDKIDLKPRFVIGSDFTLDTTHQNDALDHHHNFSQEEELLMGDTVITKNIKTAKVDQIVQEIGQKPVLVFGNSRGDYSMANYAIKDNPYLTKIYFVLCDDQIREYGNLEKANQIKKDCENNHWQTISMANDWKTIYGETVTLDK